MSDVKLVAESLQEYDQVNESLIGSLKKFMANPDKNQKSFLKGYSRMYVGKVGGDKTKKTLINLDLDRKVKIAKGSIQANAEDSNLVYPKVSKGQEGLVGTAVAAAAKKGIHKATGED